MEEENHNDALPDLKELENKVGRKTPESLLIWMRDAADCEDGGRSEVVDREERSSALSDSFSDKINNLKQEMVNIKYYIIDAVCLQWIQLFVLVTWHVWHLHVPA